MPAPDLRSGPRRRTAATIAGRVVALLAAVLVGGLSVVAPAAADVSVQASTAAEFLKRELVRLDYSFPATTPGTVDGGLIADTLIGLHAANETGEEFRRATEELRSTYFSATVRTSGLTAKYLMVARRAGVDPKDWGRDSADQPVDLVARLAETLDDNGRYRNLNAGPYDPRRDLSNVFSQSLALIAVHEYTDGADQSGALDYLARQQCPSGGFRPAPSPDDPASTCLSEDPNVGVDYTAMAVWALAETGGEPAALDRGLAWLRDRQESDGGFIAETGPNANSTGLAALALAKAGDLTNAARASGWLVSVQLPENLPEPAMVGSVAYNAEKYLEIAGDPVGFWSSPAKQDQLRRATAQAVLGLAATPASDVPPPPEPPTEEPGPPPQPEPDPGPGGAPAGGDSVAIDEARNALNAAADARRKVLATAGTVAAALSAPASGLPAPGAAPPLPGGAVPAAEPPAGQRDPAQVGRAEALPEGGGGFADFLRGPWGIGSSILLGFAVAGAGYRLAVRRGGVGGS